MTRWKRIVTNTFFRSHKLKIVIILATGIGAAYVARNMVDIQIRGNLKVVPKGLLASLLARFAEEGYEVRPEPFKDTLSPEDTELGLPQRRTISIVVDDKVGGRTAERLSQIMDEVIDENIKAS